MQNKAAGVLFQAQKCTGLEKGQTRQHPSGGQDLHFFLRGVTFSHAWGKAAGCGLAADLGADLLMSSTRETP